MTLSKVPSLEIMQIKRHLGCNQTVLRNYIYIREKWEIGNSKSGRHQFKKPKIQTKVVYKVTQIKIRHFKWLYIALKLSTSDPMLVKPKCV